MVWGTTNHNPGSDAAVGLGCTCPVMDNARGRGVLGVHGRQFWINENCPVHAPPPAESSASDAAPDPLTVPETPRQVDGGEA